MSAYAVRLLKLLRDVGPADEEEFYRMKVTGDGETHWFNITHEELERIIDALDR